MPSRDHDCASDNLLPVSSTPTPPLYYSRSSQRKLDLGECTTCVAYRQNRFWTLCSGHVLAAPGSARLSDHAAVVNGTLVPHSDTRAGFGRFARCMRLLLLWQADAWSGLGRDATYLIRGGWDSMDGEG